MIASATENKELTLFFFQNFKIKIKNYDYKKKKRIVEYMKLGIFGW